MNIKYIFAILFLFAFCEIGQSQSAQEQAVIAELEKQGVDQAEVRKRLIAEGYDPDNVDPKDPAQLLELRTAAERIVNDLKADKAAEKSKTSTADAIRPDTIPKQKDILVSGTSDADAKADGMKKETPRSPEAIYGQQLYQNQSIRFYKKSEYVNTPSDYVLGPGDVVTVSIWGRSEANFSQEISDGGFVKFTKVPRMTLSGLKLGDAKRLIRDKLRRNYPFDNENFEVKVTATRNINVFITGEVKNNGSYNISAVNTAVNALAAAGGLNSIASVRNIRIVGSGDSEKTLDLYKFMQDPKYVRDLYLNDGDYIVVPVANKVVTVEGAINRPYRYELLANESLNDLIDLAGGLRVDALKKNIKITRFENDEKVIKNVNLLNALEASRFNLKNGDLVQIGTIDEKVKNSVVVDGALTNPGEFSFNNGMKISDLMQKVDLREDAILDIAYLIRFNEDRETVNWQMVNVDDALANPSSVSNMVLNVGDRLTIRGSSSFVKSNTIEVKGALNSPGIFPLDNNNELKVSDAVFLANGLKPEATDFAYIIRNRPGSQRSEYIPVDLEAAMADIGSDNNAMLEPGDILQAYSKDQYVDDAFVTIDGAVRNPNTYKYDPSLTLKDVLLLSQGVTIDAAKNNIDIFRLEFNTNNNTRTLIANASIDNEMNVIGGDIGLQPFDQIVVRKAPEFEEQREVFITGEVKYPGKYYLINDNYSVTDLIAKAGGTTGEAFIGGATLNRSLDDVGYIVMDLDKAMKEKNSSANIILQLNDVLNIPKLNNLVTVKGAVKKSDAFNGELAKRDKINFAYEDGKSAKDYVNRSGGFAKNADKSSLTVRYPNGEIHKTKRILFFRSYPKVVPGSIISVAYDTEKIKKDNSEKEDVDWGKVLSNSIAQATTILSLILLIQNVR